MLGAKSYSSNQSRAQFSLNAILGSPMLLSMDVSSLSAFDLETYSNAEVLSSLCYPAGAITVPSLHHRTVTVPLLYHHEVLNVSADPLGAPGFQV